MSRLEAGQAQVVLTEVNLHNLLADLRMRMAIEGGQKGLVLVDEFDANLPHSITTDASKLRQILDNLLSNAIKFTQTGTITLRAGVQSPPTGSSALPKGTLWFEVEDTGQGIAREEFQHLFTTFTQTEAGRQVNQGTGLGLSLTRKFVQLLGGDIQVTSTVNYGSAFRFTIQAPFSTPLAASPAHPNSRDVVGTSASSPPETTPPKTTPPTAPEDLPHPIPSGLAALPAPWCQQLYQAALLGSDYKILQLLEQLPPSQTPLVQALTELAEQFKFDQIIAYLSAREQV